MKIKSFLKNKQNIFVLLSILFLGILVIFYGRRLVYYYKLEHPKATKSHAVLLIDQLKVQEDVGNTGVGLSKEENSYLFKGNPEKNYLSYSGRLWRIIGIDSDGNIPIITEEVQTILTSANANTWMNQDETENTGIFYQSLNKPEEHLIHTSICIDKVEDATKSTCKNTNAEHLINLLSLDTYIKAGANKSYLNNGTSFWTSTQTEQEEAWYIFNKGGANKSELDSTHNDGIRPVITLKSTTEVFSGTGTKEDPFVIDKPIQTTLQDIFIGQYVQIKNQNYRVIKKSDGKVTVVLDGTLKNGEEDIITKFDSKNNTFSTSTNIGTYLNETFLSTLTDEAIVPTTFYTGNYHQETMDYRNTYTNQIEANVGLLALGDFFINEYADTFLLTSGDNTIYTISSEQKLYGDEITKEKKIRPVFSLDGTLLLASGSGSQKDPYIVSR